MKYDKGVYTLEDGEEWATIPLLDESNVGKFVWVINNNNHKYAFPGQIVKIGRTNIHVTTRNRNTYSLRVQEGRGHAQGLVNGFMVSAETVQYQSEREERFELHDKIRQALSVNLPVEALRKITAVVKEYA